MQTVIAVFSDADEATLACQSVKVWKLREGNKPQLLETLEEARPYLEERARRAEVSQDGIERYLHDLEQGKVLLVDRVPEDEALRVISALEGAPAQSVYTLPPEPAESIRR
jgi:hypothetical protein